MLTLKKKLRLAMDAAVNLMLWGKHGVGKSSVVYEFGVEVGRRVITLILAQVEATDLIGMPKAIPILEKAARDGFKEVLLAVNGALTADSIPALLAAYADNWVTAYAMPQWMTVCLNEPVIIFLDEANRGRKFEINAVHQLVLEKRLFTHQFHPDTMVVAACNPADEDELGLTQFGAAFFSRFAHIQVSSSKEAWVAWARREKVHSSVIAHVERGGINTLNPSPTGWFAELILSQVKPNERAWEFVSRSLGALERLGSDTYSAAAWSIIEGLVGTSEKTTFMTFYEKDFKPIDPVDLFKRMPGSSDHSVERLDPDVRRRIEEWSNYGDAKLPALMESFEKALEHATVLFNSRGGAGYYDRNAPVCVYCGRDMPGKQKGQPCSDPKCAAFGGKVKLMSKKAWDDYGNFFHALLLAPGSVKQVIIDKLPPFWVNLLECFPTRIYWNPIIGAVRDVQKRKEGAASGDLGPNADGVDIAALQDGTR